MAGDHLTKIESRPLKTALGEYFFIIDLLNEAPDLLQFAYQELDSLGIQTKVLGQYQVYTLKDNGMEKRWVTNPTFYLTTSESD